MNRLIFVRDKRGGICTWPGNLGCEVDFTGCVRYGEHTLVTIRQGDVVRLSPEPA